MGSILVKSWVIVVEVTGNGRLTRRRRDGGAGDMGLVQASTAPGRKVTVRPDPNIAQV